VQITKHASPKLKDSVTNYADSFLIASVETKQFAALSQSERFLPGKHLPWSLGDGARVGEIRG
jgi:hypothetical protein